MSRSLSGSAWLSWLVSEFGWGSVLVFWRTTGSLTGSSMVLDELVRDFVDDLARLGVSVPVTESVWVGVEGREG